ncbi:MAG: NADH-ubiquinone oxidoreductase-F iron-sulfur binding region domain-containing protein [Lacunisphaera sp.]
MDFDSLGMIGTMGGSGGVIVMDDSVNMVEALANINAFYSHESCGQCTPCREGSLWMKKITTRMVHGEAREQDTALLKSVADQIPAARSARSARPVRGRRRASSRSSGDEFKGYAEAKRTKPAAEVPLI